MKKEYVKPYLAFESFQLVAALAGGCSDAGKVPLGHSIDTCTLKEEDQNVWFGTLCEVNVHDYPEWCYQNLLESQLYLTS